MLCPMKRLSTEKRATLVAALVEGNSVRATARMTDVAFNTVLKFVVDIGTACATFYDQSMRNLTCGGSRRTRFGSSATPRTRTCPRR